MRSVAVVVLDILLDHGLEMSTTRGSGWWAADKTPLTTSDGEFSSGILHAKAEIFHIVSGASNCGKDLFNQAG